MGLNEDCKGSGSNWKKSERFSFREARNGERGRLTDGCLDRAVNWVREGIKTWIL
jgi:hypothetical protein